MVSCNEKTFNAALDAIVEKKSSANQATIKSGIARETLYGQVKGKLKN